MGKYTKLKLFVASVLAITPFLGGVALATTTTPASPPAASNTATNTSENDEEASAATTQKKTRDERLAERKAALKTRVTAAEQTRLTAKCKGAQTVTKTLTTRAATIGQNRSKVYDSISKDLAGLTAKLKENKIDTVTLEAQIAEFEAKVKTLQEDLATYKTALEDMTEMDCVKDPTGFKASLEEARTLREELAKQSTDIRVYLETTIKKTLQDIRTELKGADAAAGTTETGADANANVGTDTNQ